MLFLSELSESDLAALLGEDEPAWNEFDIGVPTAFGSESAWNEFDIGIPTQFGAWRPFKRLGKKLRRLGGAISRRHKQNMRHLKKDLEKVGDQLEKSGISDAIEDVATAVADVYTGGAASQIAAAAKGQTQDADQQALNQEVDSRVAQRTGAGPVLYVAAGGIPLLAFLLL